MNNTTVKKIEKLAHTLGFELNDMEIFVENIDENMCERLSHVFGFDLEKFYQTEVENIDFKNIATPDSYLEEFYQLEYVNKR